ncbi:RNA polymerase sigma factor [Microbacterium ulmi]|uniref:Sigma-70 family RNA polymerase sigma factor n=1 Tax=Microbacterium ulmi TaxID=179095 RepID=A0A7Y2Q0D8_9MICO|nr:sigma-70 family RNA polymerase sigma factor [Microbacterium ulmi]NII70020.1 RNA polymerase sigma factor (sigma-70 family) [Microbacterium ulmi]NNH05456.1 sigma-70 family RNA polymerase sigma factor [Microbacterium ulmi]
MGAVERPQPHDGGDDDVLGTAESGTEHDIERGTEHDTEHDIARWERAGAFFVRWLNGEARAMDDLVRLMSPVLWHIVRAYGLDSALAEDVVQTTWLTLVHKHDTIHDPRAVSGWLTITARREAWRVSRQHRRADATDTVDLELRLPATPSAEHTAALSDESRRLWDAVGRLAERCQRLLRVIAFDERPDYAHLAEELKMPIGSIGPTRQRCLGKLRELLEAEGQGRSA